MVLEATVCSLARAVWRSQKTVSETRMKGTLWEGYLGTSTFSAGPRGKS